MDGPRKRVSYKVMQKWLGNNMIQCIQQIMKANQ